MSVTITGSRSILKRVLLAVTAGALLLGTPAAALARGYDHSQDRDDYRSSSHNRGDYRWGSDRDDHRYSSNKHKSHDSSKHKKHQDEPTCEERQAKLDSRVASTNRHFARHMLVMGWIDSGLRSYVDENALEVENYDQLTADTDAAQATASADVEALAALDPQINCDDPEDKSSVEEYKDQLRTTVDSVRDYRSTLFSLMQAVIAAATEVSEPEPAAAG